MSGAKSGYALVTERMIALLEQGTVPWRRPWQGGGRARNLVSRRPYRGINAFLLNAAHFASPYWCTFRQATELGGHVRRGERGTPIVFFGTGRAKEASEANEKRRDTYVFLRRFTVFNAEQLEGVEVPDVLLDSRTALERIEAAETIAAHYANGPKIEHGGDRAFYRPSVDLVGLPPRERFDSAEAYYQTLFHELGHSTGHGARLARKEVTDGAMFGDHAYSKEELVAEMTAAFLCGEAGISAETEASSAAYLESWVRALQGDVRLITTAAAQAQRAADHILGTAEPEPGEDPPGRLEGEDEETREPSTHGAYHMRGGD